MSEFQNPQNQPGIDKRVMIIFAVAMLLLVAAQQFLVKPQPPASQQQPATERRRLRRRQQSGCDSRSGGRGSRRPVAAVQAASESTTVVENDLYRITFTNRGGLVKSWILKKYTDETGHPLELVQEQAAAQYGFPLSLWTWDEPLRETLNSALYVASRNR